MVYRQMILKWPSIFNLSLSCIALLSTGVNSDEIAGRSSRSTPWALDVEKAVEFILSTHPHPYSILSKAQWHDSALELIENPPKTEAQRALSIYRLLALAADGHTEEAITPDCLRGAWLPLIIRRFGDGWFIRTGDVRYQDLFGKRIVRLNELSINEVVSRVRSIVSSDNSIGALDETGRYMRNTLILEALEISQRGSVEFTVQDSTGSEFTSFVTATSDSWVTDSWRDVDQALNSGEKPLYRRFDRNYDFVHLKETQTLYVWFEKVRDEEDESIAQFCSRMFEYLEANNIAKLILDIRENSGGNLYLNEPLLHGLIRAKKVNRPGGLYVIIGRDTYSAAMNLAVSLEKHTHAIFVGEPTGATPNHFGDTEELTLPNSGVTIEVSALYWQNSDPRDTRPWITPDIPVTLSFSDFVNHRDPLLDACLNHTIAGSDTLTQLPLYQRWQRANQFQIDTGMNR